MKKISLIVTLFLLVCSTTVFASTYLGTLGTWASNTDSVDEWDKSSIRVRSTVLNASFDDFSPGITHAISEWSNTGVPVTRDEGYGTREIEIIGGTASQILASTGYDIGSATGVTGSYSASYQGYYNAASTIIDHYHVASSTIMVYIKDYVSYRDYRRYYKTITHELGHALGYCGHFTNSSAVMYFSNTTNYQLITSEENHLSQVY